MQTSTPTATPTDNRRCIKKLKSRFERWELTHLRELAASLHEQLQEAESRALDAERRANWFMDTNHDMEQELRNCGKQMGLTMQGELVLMPDAPQRLVCDDFGNLVAVPA